MKIYQYFEAVPSRLLGIAQLLSRHTAQTISNKDIIALMQPKFLPKTESPMAVGVIAVALRINLLEEYQNQGEKYLRFSSEAKTLIGDYKQLSVNFPIIMSNLLLRPIVNDKKNYFALVTGWLLAQPVTEMPQGHADLKTAMESQGFDLEELGLRNDARWDVLLYWVKYLGLAWQTQDEKCKGIVPDPALFLLRNLDQILPPGGEIPISEFRTSLGKFCPVLDGGLVRQTVLETMVHKGNQQPWSEDRLSFALSFSLRRLRESGHIRYWCPDDQKTFFLSALRNEKIAFIKRDSQRSST